MDTIVTVDSFRRWYRKLIAHTYTAHRRGRPRHDEATRNLVMQLARDNPDWGHQTIADRVTELGNNVSKRAVGSILRRAGIPPAPERRKLTDFPRFIEAHWPGLIAMDCATWEVPETQENKTMRHHALYAIRVATREVRLLGVTNRATGQWVAQCCRNLTGADDHFTEDANAIVMDRDPLYIDAAKECFRSIGCEVKITPPKCPRCNAFIERFIGTTRRDLRGKIIPLSTSILENALRTHVDYYNRYRTHQSLPGHRMPVPTNDRFTTQDGEVMRTTLLGKTLSFYERRAA